MMLASIAEREQSFPTAGRLPVAFRSLSAAKVRKIIQKTTFGEDINTISKCTTEPTLLCTLSRARIHAGLKFGDTSYTYH